MIVDLIDHLRLYFVTQSIFFKKLKTGILMYHKRRYAASRGADFVFAFYIFSFSILLLYIYIYIYILIGIVIVICIVIL